MALIEDRYVFPDERVLSLEEKMIGLTDDDFVVTDKKGHQYFKLSKKFFSLGENKVLKDTSGNKVLVVHKKRLTIGNKWTIERADGTTVALCKKAKLSIKPTMKVAIKLGKNAPSDNESDNEDADVANSVADGDFKAVGSLIKGSKKFKVYDSSGRQVGLIKKMGKFSSLEGYVRSKVTDADKYTITVAAGMDAAFMVGLGIVIDELFHDEPPKPEGEEHSEDDEDDTIKQQPVAADAK